MSARRASFTGHAAVLTVGLLIALAVAAVAVWAGEKPQPKEARYTATWAIGELEYPHEVSGIQNYFTVWTDSVPGGGKLGRLCGEVTKDTKIRFGNRDDLRKEQLALLSHHQVFVWARVYTVSHEEGSKQYLEAIDVYVLN